MICRSSLSLRKQGDRFTVNRSPAIKPYGGTEEKLRRELAELQPLAHGRLNPLMTEEHQDTHRTLPAFVLLLDGFLTQERQVLPELPCRAVGIGIAVHFRGEQPGYAVNVGEPKHGIR